MKRKYILIRGLDPNGKRIEEKLEIIKDKTTTGVLSFSKVFSRSLMIEEDDADASTTRKS